MPTVTAEHNIMAEYIFSGSLNGKKQSQKALTRFKQVYIMHNFTSPIAQSVERRTVNPQVPGSSPGRGAKIHNGTAFCCAVLLCENFSDSLKKCSACTNKHCIFNIKKTIMLFPNRMLYAARVWLIRCIFRRLAQTL